MKQTWLKKTLKDVAPSKSAKFPAVDETVWNLSLEEIESGTGKILREVSSKVGELGSSKTSFDEKNVLYSKLRPYLNKVVVPEKSGVGTSELIPLFPNPEILDREFLAFYLRSPKFLEFAKTNTQGTNLPRVSMTNFWQHEIEFPQIGEQQRIVGRIKECLSRVDEIKHLRGENLLEAKSIVRAALNEIWELDEITTAPTKSLDLLGNLVTGNTPSRKVPEYFGGEFPWVTPGDFNGEKYLTGAREFLSSKGLKEGKARVVKANSILVVCIGATIGKVAMANSPLGMNQQINSVTFGDEINPDFGYWALRAKHAEIISNASQSTLPILNKSRFGQLEIPVPQRDIQERIARRLDEFDTASKQMIEEFRISLKELKITTQAILRKAFAGEL